MYTSFWWGNQRGKERPLGRPRGRCEEMLERILKKSVVRVWSRLIWLMVGTIGGCCGCGSEHADFLNLLLDQLKNFQVFRKDSATWI